MEATARWKMMFFVRDSVILLFFFLSLPDSSGANSEWPRWVRSAVVLHSFFLRRLVYLDVASFPRHAEQSSPPGAGLLALQLYSLWCSSRNFGGSFASFSFLWGTEVTSSWQGLRCWRPMLVVLSEWQDSFNPFNYLKYMNQGLGWSSCPPKVSYHLLDLWSVQDQMRTGCFTTCLSADEVIRSAFVIASSTKFISELDGWMGMQLWVKKGNDTGLETQP